MPQAAQWLSRRDDTVKINHQIAAAAALAAVWRLTGEERWHRAAKRKLEVSLAHQSEEGWFSELGAVDLGYASVPAFSHAFRQVTGKTPTEFADKG